MSDAPETDRIMENIQIAIAADTREQSIAHREEARREIENLSASVAPCVKRSASFWRRCNTRDGG